MIFSTGIRLARLRCATQLLEPSSIRAIRQFSITAKMASTEPQASAAPPAPPDITATPAVDQHIFYGGKEYTTVREGLAYILVPASAPKVPKTSPQGDNQPQDVFYNPIQQFNRDLSVLAIKAFGEQVLEQRKQNQEKIRKKFVNRKKNKKRKREHDDLGTDTSRKAGKLDGAAQTAGGEGDVMDEEVNDGMDAEGQLQKELLEEEQEIEAPNGAEDPNPTPISGEGENGISAATTEEAGKNDLKPKHPPSFTILDALSATGLRALRYVHEIPFTTSVTANDLLPEATKTINLNIKHNRLENKITATTGNAMSHMYSLLDDSTRDARNHPLWSRKYNVIDLDPYGTAAPFLDAAVQAVRDDGGLLCVTCTDAGVWASNGYPEKCFALYGGTPIKGQHSHEGGLRLILHAIATSAARYGLVMQPLLSLSIDFYARVFVKIHRSPIEVKFLAGKTMMVYNCDSGCGAWTTQLIGRNRFTTSKKGVEIWKHQFAQGPTANETCEHCGSKTHVAGPMYAGPLHDPVFVKKILDDLPGVDKEVYKTTARIEGMLSMALEECLDIVQPKPSHDGSAPETELKSYDPSALDPAPFLFIPSVLSKVVHCVTPIENCIRGALRGLGYRVTRSHTKPGSIKTDAPWSVVWEVMREWVRQRSPVKEGAVREGTAGWKILSLGEKNDGEDGEGKEKLKVVFDEALGREKDVKKLVRFQHNPRENWGPMAKAKGKA